MIVYVKEIGTRRTPFTMRKESADKLVANNKGKYEIISDEPVQEIVKTEVKPTTKKKEQAPLNAAEGEE